MILDPIFFLVFAHWSGLRGILLLRLLAFFLFFDLIQDLLPQTISLLLALPVIFLFGLLPQV